MNIKSKNINSQLLAGAAKSDITPPPGTIINGDFIAHYASHIHDNLYAKALVIQQGKIVMIMVVVDICLMTKEYVDEIKAGITEQTGVPFQNILISCTHTHAAGSVASVYLVDADPMYMKKLPGLIIEAVQNAIQNLKPAKVGFGSVDVPEHVRCRRYFMKDEFKPFNPVSGLFDKVKTNPFGAGKYIIGSVTTPDPQVSFIAVKGMDDSWISLLANYSLHYVGDWDNGTISADYFGEFSSHVKEKLKAGDDFVGIMSNGTSGDINIWDFENTGTYPTGNFMKSRLIGHEIAEKVCEAIGHIQWEEHPEVRVTYEDLSVDVRKPDKAALEIAKLITSSTDYGSLAIDDAGLRSIFAREQVLLAEFPDQFLFPVQVVKIGSIVIGALAAEVFAETGLWLRTNSPYKKYFTIGLANGNLGYLPPEHEIARGGYETWRSRTCKLKEDAEEKVKNKLMQMIENLADNKN